MEEIVIARNPKPYTERITQNPEIMTGKPVVKGTRIPVERVLAHLSQNSDLADLFAAYPELTEEDVKACFAYAHAMIEHHGTKPSRHLSVPAAHL
jgi:uncharacterized protein (DUF433 family)